MRIRALALVTLAACAGAFALAPAAGAYSVEVKQFSNGVTGVLLTGTAADETIAMQDLGDGRVSFQGNAAATAIGSGCTVSGNNATCTLQNSTTNITLRGNGGNDTLTARSAPRSLSLEGGEGNDVLSVESARPVVGATFSTALRGGAGDDVLIGSPSPDSMDGGADDDVLVGNAGNDRLLGGIGADVMSGGDGIDDATYLVDGFRDRRTQGISVQIGDGVCNDGGALDAAQGARPALPAGITSSCGASAAGTGAADEVLDAEIVVGTDGADEIIGSAADNTLNGLGGNDTLEGGGGVDMLVGDSATDSGADLLLARDLVADAGLVCGASPGVGDRAIADPEDPVDTSCETVERGGEGVTGPSTAPGGGPIVVENPGTTGGEPEAGQPDTEPTPIPAPETAPAGSPPTGGTEASTTPGGGDGGLTPPQLRIFGRTLIVDGKGRAQTRITCVYKAKECVGVVLLTAGKTLKAGKRTVLRGATVGTATVSIPWGRTANVAVRVSKRFRVALKAQGRRKSTTLVLTVAARDGDAGAGAKTASAQRRLRTSLRG